MDHATSLTDTALTSELGRLAGREREATAAFIVHLAEFDARRLYEGTGHSSTFSYCRVVLRLSEDAAYNRIKAARMARRYPAIVQMLLDGSLSPTTVRLLAPYLTTENHQVLLAEASGRGKQEVEELLARWFPRADVPSSVRKLPHRSSVAPAGPVVGIGGSAVTHPAPAVGASSAALPSVPVTPAIPLVDGTARSKRALVRPLAPARFEIRFTADDETHRLLREAQDLLSHTIPTGDLAAVFRRALTVLVADLKRRKFGATSRPRSNQAPNAESRTPAAAVRREVVPRDATCCAFVAPDGRRCEERRFLEFHHVVPYSVGGRATATNIQLRCRAHNGHEVDLFFGPGRRWVREPAGMPAWARSAIPRSGTGT
jgi:hypothetical protein